ncbi:MAG: PaaI family thioesterase [Planctomycetes bacterium]|nr:PaaI family thioesterase [Planctomycetota bacterium]
MPDKKCWLEIMGHDAYAELIGLEVVHAEPGRAEVRLTITPKVLNGHGNVHGGAIFTLADYAGALASNMLGDPTIATNGSIAFLRPAGSGILTAKARTVKSGRRMKYLVVDICNDRDELIAVFHGGAITVHRKNPAPPLPEVEF